MKKVFKDYVTNRCDKCNNLEAKLYEILIRDDVYNEDKDIYEEVDILDYEILECTKCGYEEKI